ncbi:MAG: FKBP-type peptidyl-prolyl cis-trans isomerase [Candidatus Micrarchaeia archaeon]
MKNIIIILFSVLLLFGCIGNEIQPDTNTGQNQTNNTILFAQTGDLVTVDYVGYFDDGTVFDTSIKVIGQQAGLAKSSYAPLQFLLGSGQMISGFEAGIIGMKIEEEKTIHLTPDEAYGQIKQNLIMTFPLEMMPENISVGTILITEDNWKGKVINMTNETGTVDFNHEFAGKNLTFDILIVDIERE